VSAAAGSRTAGGPTEEGPTEEGPSEEGPSEDGLAVCRLSVRFGRVPAVDAVSCAVRPGEVLAMLGPSGCGKSTLLRAVAGLEPTEPGAVRWDGVDLARVPVHRRAFGLMFQDGQLFPHRDVGGNVGFGLRMAGVPRPTRVARVGELLELVGLDGWQRRNVATLSGGEQQRVALARALAARPRLLLLDEPLSSLDRALRERLASQLSDILRRTGTTALYVTHDHDEAFAVADRVGVMDHGALLQVAKPSQLWRRPGSERVARFLGYRSFVRGADLQAAVGEPLCDDLGPHDLVGLRPESLLVDPAGPVAATVLDHRLTRTGTSLTVEAGRLGAVEASAPGAHELAVGAGVRLRLEPAAIAHLPGAAP